ncbi:MAG: UTP--glucose-1-phosphate uridylyltransferase [Chitinispirillaceae bacterium]
MPDVRAQYLQKLDEANLPASVKAAFSYYYTRLLEGQSGFIYEEDIDPLPAGTIPSMKTTNQYKEIGARKLSQTAIIKLNGGLGTTMGLEGPKCLLPAKQNFSFLDISISQIKALRRAQGINIPFVLMNSFKTHRQTLGELWRKHDDFKNHDIPLTFEQNRFPKVLENSLEPVSYPEDRQLEWSPPGHGDIYNSMRASGLLESFKKHGIKYLFISNIDNLGAVIDTGLLGYFADKDAPFLMEVVERTEMDKKGGHLARLKNGQLILRELAQTSSEQMDSFQNISRYHYFNSNNIWLNIEYLEELLDQNEGFLPLPMIRNRKNLDPREPNSPKVIQIESAMGSAISQFSGAEAVHVDNSRYRPVKRSEDLLALWSDLFTMHDDYTIHNNPSRNLGNIIIELDKKYYKHYDQLQNRFPHGAPSLIPCESLHIEGDVCFGENVTLEGVIRLVNKTDEQVHISDNRHITGEFLFE